MRAAAIALVAMLATGAAHAQASPDPVAATVGQEWQASEVARGHLAEALQKLVQAYTALQQKEADTAAWWKAYVAGLTPGVATAEPPK